MACLSRGASYFVDYVGGADTNAGTSSVTAFKHCPGDPAATNTASSTTLAADDFVFFKGGVTYVLTGATGILITSSGTSGHPITYDGNSAGTFGTGKAILTNNYAVSNQAALDGGASTRSYITTKYFAVQNMGGSAVLPTDTGSAIAARPGYAVTYGGGSVGCIIDQIDVNGCGYVYNQKPMDSSSIDSTAVYLTNASGATVSNCTFTRVCVPIGFQVTTASALSASTISNCTFHDYIKWCIDLSVTINTANFPAVNIIGCTFYDTPQYDASNWTGYGVGPPHTDGIFLRNDFYANTWAMTVISGCTFYNTNNTYSSGGSGWISATEGPNVAIINNVFPYGQKFRGSIYIHNTSTPLSPANPQVIIANNTGISAGATIITFQGPGFGTTSFTVKNNLWFQTSTSTTAFAVYDDNGSASMAAGSLDYNLYETNNPTNAGTYGGTLGQDIWSSATLATDFGITLLRTSPRFWDLHGDNNFTRLNTVNANPLLCNFHTLSNSFARNAGTNLTSLGVSALLTDAAGITRPSAGAWDIGAYQDSVSTAFSSSLTGKVLLTGKTQIK